MKDLLGCCALVGLLLSPLVAAVEPDSASSPRLVRIEITGMESAGGSLHIAVFNSDEAWLGKDTVKRQEVVIAEALEGNLVKTELQLMPGEYAFTIYHDSNNNGELDTNFIGIPKEPVAVSNNAISRFGPPKYRDAVFDLQDEEIVQRISMEKI